MSPKGDGESPLINYYHPVVEGIGHEHFTGGMDQNPFGVVELRGIAPNCAAAEGTDGSNGLAVGGPKKNSVVSAVRDGHAVVRSNEEPLGIIKVIKLGARRTPNFVQEK
jgi:hypothetical protein